LEPDREVKDKLNHIYSRSSKVYISFLKSPLGV